jgi:peptide/nickel transport system substrate-binding protein
MKHRTAFLTLVAALLLVAACAPRPSSGTSAETAPAARLAGKTLVMVAGDEPPSFATKPLGEPAPNPRATHTKHVLNAALLYADERGLPQPFLAEALPDLHTGTWALLPDGRMETTYRLKPNLAWHDSNPLTADDFVFSWRVYATPEFGVSDSAGFRSIEEVLALDPRTVLIRWKENYTEAGSISSVNNALPPLPRHILEQLFQDRQGNSFTSLPFWTTEYVGAGPWRLERREPGAFFEGTAFDGFVFGRPKIDRVRVMYQPDANTVVANLLAGEAHYSVEFLLHGEEGITLERAWASSDGGRVLWETDLGKGMEIQQRPEFAVPVQLATDARVRQALAFAIDKIGMNEVVTAGHGLVREIYSHPNADYYERVLREVPNRQTYDPRRAEQLLQTAGFSRGGDGFWLTPTGDRFTLEQWYLAGATNERESTILVDMLRRAGIDASANQWGIQRTSNEERVKTSGIFGGAVALPDRYHSRAIARAETRWTGTNRFGFSSPDLDRYVDAYTAALDRDERIQDLAQMERIALDQMPAITTYYTAAVIAHAAALKGVVRNLVPEAGGERKMWSWEWGG